MKPSYSAAVLGTLGALCVAGCASTSDSTSQESPSSRTGRSVGSPAKNLTGTWEGNAGLGARGTPVTLILQQQGPAVQGNLAVDGRPDMSGPVMGTVEGAALRLQLPNGEASPPELRVDGDTISGVINGEPMLARRVR